MRKVGRATEEGDEGMTCLLLYWRERDCVVDKQGRLFCPECGAPAKIREDRKYIGWPTCVHVIEKDKVLDLGKYDPDLLLS